MQAPAVNLAGLGKPVSFFWCHVDITNGNPPTHFLAALETLLFVVKGTVKQVRLDGNSPSDRGGWQIGHSLALNRHQPKAAVDVNPIPSNRQRPPGLCGG